MFDRAVFSVANLIAAQAKAGKNIILKPVKFLGRKLIKFYCLIITLNFINLIIVGFCNFKLKG